MLRLIAHGQATVQDPFAQLPDKGARALVERFRIQRPHEPGEKSGHGSRLHNDHVPPGWQFFGFVRATLGFFDCRQGPLLDFQVIDRPVRSGGPSGRVPRLNRQAEPRLSPFFVGEEA